MKTKLLSTTLIVLTIFSCNAQTGAPNPWPAIGSIPPPTGYHRPVLTGNPFGAWLRGIPLKRDRTVYLYNGQPKRNQDAQFAVLDISVGNADLQQCADAVMRLRAEFLYAGKEWKAIDFYTEQGIRLNYGQWIRQHPITRAGFDQYLTKVFTYCSTRTLEKQLTPKSLREIAAGDVLIKGGAPGHAMIVVDVAEDAQGRRVYLLAQSYMPAQDIHLVRNPTEPAISPWYRADLGQRTGETAQMTIETPEWTFTTNQLRTWPAPPAKP